jgi:hypothetical protein
LLRLLAQLPAYRKRRQLKMAVLQKISRKILKRNFNLKISHHRLIGVNTVETTGSSAELILMAHATCKEAPDKAKTRFIEIPTSFSRIFLHLELSKTMSAEPYRLFRDFLEEKGETRNYFS